MVLDAIHKVMSGRGEVDPDAITSVDSSHFEHALLRGKSIRREHVDNNMY